MIARLYRMTIYTERGRPFHVFFLKNGPLSVRSKRRNDIGSFKRALVRGNLLSSKEAQEIRIIATANGSVDDLNDGML